MAATCISKLDLQIFATCTQDLLNSPRQTISSSSSFDGKVIPTTNPSSTFSMESITFGSNKGNSEIGKGLSQKLSTTEKKNGELFGEKQVGGQVDIPEKSASEMDPNSAFECATKCESKSSRSTNGNKSKSERLTD